LYLSDIVDAHERVAGKVTAARASCALASTPTDKSVGYYHSSASPTFAAKPAPTRLGPGSAQSYSVTQNQSVIFYIITK